jgi:peptidyl-prolyl cis-trans isomerase SurA
MKKILILATALLTFQSMEVFAQKKTAAKPGKTPVTAAPAATPKKSDLSTNYSELLRVGDSVVSVAEFDYVYKKNNNTDSLYVKQNLDEYLNLFTKFKMKVLDAYSAGLDTTTSFKKELESYRKQLAQPYLTEKKVSEQLVKEAYERMKQEVNASHILIMVTPDAAPSDTLAKYKKIQDIRKKALAGADFEELAKQYSEDPSAQQNSGSLGYFTALGMVYPFEQAAYSTPIGKISSIVRTRFGYHILKVNDKRPNQGQVKVAHIMAKFQSGQSKADSTAAMQKIDEISKKLAKGDSFETLAQQFSDDQGTKDKGGELPMFSAGQMIQKFEDIAFALKKTGDLSKPFQTQYGFHIVKLLEKKSLESFSELETSIKDKVSRDSRSELNQAVLIARLRKENNVVENLANLKRGTADVDTSLLSQKYKVGISPMDAVTVLTIKGKNYSAGNFKTFLAGNQAAHKSSDLQYVISLNFKDFVNQTLLDYEEQNLETKYQDFRMLMREYREGILLFSRMDNKVWSKAVEDTTGLRTYFNQNANKYKWETRVKATIYNVKDTATLSKVKQMLAMKSFPVAEPTFKAALYAKNEFKQDPAVKSTLQALGDFLRRDKNLSVEVVAYADNAEKKKTDLKRANSVKDSLVKYGATVTQITIRLAAKTELNAAAPADNQKVIFNMLSSSPKALERVLNNNAPLTVQVTDGAFQKGENKLLDGLTWKAGTQTITQGERTMYVIIHGVEQPRNKTLDECRGTAISDFQTYLEAEWIKALSAKYPVKINKPVMESIMKK